MSEYLKVDVGDNSIFDRMCIHIMACATCEQVCVQIENGIMHFAVPTMNEKLGWESLCERGRELVSLFVMEWPIESIKKLDEMNNEW